MALKGATKRKFPCVNTRLSSVEFQLNQIKRATPSFQNENKNNRKSISPCIEHWQLCALQDKVSLIKLKLILRLGIRLLTHQGLRGVLLNQALQTVISANFSRDVLLIF